MQRYHRQIILTELGTAGQTKLQQAKVLVIGAGGLGCPALQYLVAAGVGNIGILDFDTIDHTNLNRQILFTENDIGKLKSVIAKNKLSLLNSAISIISYPIKIQNENALSILKNYDLVLDCTDNFMTRYMINDACVILNKPLIYGAILKFEGQLAVFNLENKLTKIKTNYRDLFPQPPDANTVQSCNEAGVLGVMPGIIGTMQATEAIKIISGIGQPLCNMLLTYNALNNSVYTFEISKTEKENSSIPRNEKAFLNFNYDYFCNKNVNGYEINSQYFHQLRTIENITIVDVRELNEGPEINLFPHLKIPISIFENQMEILKNDTLVVFICQSGNRSLKACKLLNKKYPDLKAYSLQGGIAALQ